jgi:hypothetical protein
VRNYLEQTGNPRPFLKDEDGLYRHAPSTEGCHQPPSVEQKTAERQQGRPQLSLGRVLAPVWILSNDRSSILSSGNGVVSITKVC